MLQFAAGNLDIGKAPADFRHSGFQAGLVLILFGYNQFQGGKVAVQYGDRFGGALGLVGSGSGHVMDHAGDFARS